jgi:phosphatidylglycerol:prolipoprotein diacylglycerol transferase
MNIFELKILWITISPTYYGLMYALWFMFWYWIIKKRISQVSKKKKTVKNTLAPKTTYKMWDFMDSLLFYIFFWVVIWWRLWYTLFYNFEQYIAEPLAILRVWEWWMSFHWWVIWVIIAMMLFSRKHKINFYSLADEVTAILPIGLGLWRIWNYLNQELLGFSGYTWPLAIRTSEWSFFPSPLLEFFLEWVVLYILLTLIHARKKFAWQVACSFLLIYATFRIIVELFFRTPDAHIGYIFSWVSLGVLYSLPMIVFWLYYYARCKKIDSAKNL